MLVKSRSDALRDGDTHYFTGVPCKRGHVGLRYTRTCNCVDCNKRADHVEAQKIRVKRSVSAKPEKYKAAQKKWWGRNREKACGYAKAYRSRNPEKTKADGAKWDAANRDRRVEYARKQHAKRSSRLAKDYGDFDAFVMLEARRACRRREKITGYEWHVDHMIPLNKGGIHKYDNIQVIPAWLNRLKSDKLMYTKRGEWVSALVVEPKKDD